MMAHLHGKNTSCIAGTIISQYVKQCHVKQATTTNMDLIMYKLTNIRRDHLNKHIVELSGLLGCQNICTKEMPKSDRVGTGMSYCIISLKLVPYVTVTGTIHR